MAVIKNDLSRGPGPEPGGRSAGRAKGSGRRLGRFMIWRAVYAFLHFEARAKGLGAELAGGALGEVRHVGGAVVLVGCPRSCL